MAPNKDPKFASPIKPPQSSSINHEENEEIQTNYPSWTFKSVD